MDYLQNDLPKLTLEQAKFKQSIGLNKWDPMPEGVEYPSRYGKIVIFTKNE